MDFICKDNYGRDILREERGQDEYVYHVQAGGKDALVVSFNRAVPLSKVLQSIEGMRTGLGTPEQARAILKAKVNEIREAKQDEPITFNGVVYDGDPVSQARLTGTLLAIVSAIVAGAPAPASVSWRAMDNTDQLMTLVELVGFGNAFFARGYACHLNGRALKAAIDAASDPESVDISAGWPS